MSSPRPHARLKPPASALAVGRRHHNKRSPKACQGCRNRKVRCDRQHGVSCTRCKGRKVQCILPLEGLRWKSNSNSEGSHRSEGTNGMFPSSIFDDIDGQISLAASGETTPYDAIMQHSEHALSNNKRGMLCEKPQYIPAADCSLSTEVDQGHSHSTNLQERPCDMSPITSIENADDPISVSEHRTLKTIHYSDHQISQPDIVLPRYIRFEPSMMTGEDLEYLQKKGAFVMPGQGLRNELLRCYVQYIHAYLPLLNLGHFLTSIFTSESAHSTSLLLFQAVMFASTLFIDEKHLTTQGYMTRKAASKAFFQRAKLLYDSDYEADRMTIVQAALLMSYWQESPDDLKDGWHWPGIAISLTTVATRTCTVTYPWPTEALKLRAWKRIWWSCYMRDRLIAIGMRRPMRISQGDFNIPMLELSDFETDALPQELSLMLGSALQADDFPTRVLLARMCMSLVKLCVCITQLLELKYSALGKTIIGARETSMRLMLERPTDPCDLIRCDRDLEAWYGQLPPELRYFAPSSLRRDLKTGGDVLNIHRAVLTGVYLTSMSILHRPQMPRATPRVDMAPELRELSRRKARNAANDIIAMYEGLYARDLIRYLPNTGVTCLLPATIIHLLDIKHHDPIVRQLGRRKFEFCIQALTQLRERYASANLAFSFLDEVVRYADLQPNPVSSALQRHGQSLKKRPEFDRTQRRRQDGWFQQPPAEAAQMASWLLAFSTLTKDEKKLIAPFAHNGSSSSPDESSKSSIADGTTVSLADLGDVMIQEPSSTTYQNGRIQPAQVDVAIEQAFESLIDIEMGAALSSSDNTRGNHIEMNLQWLGQINASGKANETGTCNKIVSMHDDHLPRDHDSGGKFNTKSP